MCGWRAASSETSRTGAEMWEVGALPCKHSKPRHRVALVAAHMRRHQQACCCVTDLQCPDSMLLLQAV